MRKNRIISVILIIIMIATIPVYAFEFDCENSKYKIAKGDAVSVDENLKSEIITFAKIGL